MAAPPAIRSCLILPKPASMSLTRSKDLLSKGLSSCDGIALPSANGKSHAAARVTRIASLKGYEKVREARLMAEDNAYVSGLIPSSSHDRGQIINVKTEVQGYPYPNPK
jgi:hypothetical protein